jgi:two-component system sensor histidine kinase PilS (NtrC family)
MALREDLPPTRHAQELRLLLKILMIFRVATVSILLGVTVVIQIKGSQVLLVAPLFTIYLLIIAVYLLTIFYATIFNQVRNISRFAGYQVGTDLIIYTLIVFFTGGHSSPFPFLYLFSILWAALALPGGGYWTASIASIFYGGIVDLQYYGVLLPPYAVDPAGVVLANPWDIMGRVVLHLTAFFAVAFLGHQISQRYRSTREELTERTEDLEKLRTLSDVVFESVTSGLVVLDGSGRVRSLNSAAAHMLALERVSGRGLQSHEIFKGIPIPELLEKAAKGGLNRWEGSFTEESGHDRVLGLSISPLKKPEKGYVVIFQDLTDLRDLETRLRTSEKLSAIGRMAASIAHEVRNPLASMSGSIQVLKRDLDLKEDDLHLMDIILKETERLNDLVGNFLDYARPPSPRFEDVDLREMVMETVNLLEGVSEEKNIAIRTELPEEKVILSVDASHMRQIIVNLVNNSVEALDNGGTITVTLARESGPEGEFSSLSVSDNGAGIPKEILSEIFEPFKTTKEDGTGLGLAIVYQLVQIHKGTIDVHSEAGKGTTMTIRLAPWRTM